MAQRRQFASRTHRTGDPSRFVFGGVVRRNAFCQRGSSDIHVIRLIGHVVLGKVDSRAVERVGFDYIATHVEKCGMDILDSVWSSDKEIFVAAFEPQTTEIVQRQVLNLQIRAHRAVKDNDAFFKSVEKAAHYFLECADSSAPGESGD